MKVFSAKCCGHTQLIIEPEQSAKVVSAIFSFCTKTRKFSPLKVSAIRYLFNSKGTLADMPSQVLMGTCVCVYSMGHKKVPVFLNTYRATVILRSVFVSVPF